MLTIYPCLRSSIRATQILLGSIPRHRGQGDVPIIGTLALEHRPMGSMGSILGISNLVIASVRSISMEIWVKQEALPRGTERESAASAGDPMTSISSDRTCCVECDGRFRARHVKAIARQVNRVQNPDRNRTTFESVISARPHHSNNAHHTLFSGERSPVRKNGPEIVAPPNNAANPIESFSRPACTIWPIDLSGDWEATPSATLSSVEYEHRWRVESP